MKRSHVRVASWFADWQGLGLLSVLSLVSRTWWDLRVG